MPKKSQSKPKLREKLKKLGVTNLTPQELLTILLGTGIKGTPSSKLAALILKNFPLREFQTLTVPKLMALPGLGLAQAAKILVSIELGRRNALPPSEKIMTPEAVLPYISDIRTKTREYAICLYLNARSELLHQETVALGGMNYSMLEVRDILAPALTLPALACILVHNHPSGSLEPSAADLTTTRKIEEACDLLGIHFLDHLIVTHQSYFSFKQAGLLGSEELGSPLTSSLPSALPRDRPSP